MVSEVVSYNDHDESYAANHFFLQENWRVAKVEMLIWTVSSSSRFGGESEERQVSTLLYCLRENAEDVLDTTRISAEDKKKYAKVVEAFDAHFKVRKNIIFEHARFNNRYQLQGESVKQFITEVHRLAEYCEFRTMKDKLILW